MNAGLPMEDATGRGRTVQWQTVGARARRSERTCNPYERSFALSMGQPVREMEPCRCRSWSENKAARSLDWRNERALIQHTPPAGRHECGDAACAPCADRLSSRQAPHRCALILEEILLRKLAR